MVIMGRVAEGFACLAKKDIEEEEKREKASEGRLGSEVECAM